MRIIKKVSKNTARSSQKTIITKALEGIKEPLIVTDSWGMRFTHYTTDSETLEVVTSKEFYEPELLAMRRLVRKGSTVVDVGANIGLFSVFLSREIGPGGELHAFEPVKDTFWRMQENLALNRCTNVTTNQLALSNKRGRETMNIFPEGYGAWNTFGKPVFGETKAVSKEKVTKTTLVDYCKDHGIKKIDFLKIDVEGFERDVLNGAGTLLAENRVKYLSFEISEIPLKGAGRSGLEIFDLLRSYGYSAYEFDPKLKRFKGPVESSEAFYQNFYASRSDMRKL